MTKFRKFTDWVWLHQWVAVPIMYVAMCVWMYMTASVTIEGVALPQHDAGIIALATWHGILITALAGAWLLNKIVELFGRIKKNKKS